MADCPQEEEGVVVSEVVTPSPADFLENASNIRTTRPVASPVESQEDPQSQLECPICLQSCVHPVELPCKHIFCFLCIKGVAMQGPHGRCAICRSNIPHNVLTHPRLKDVSQLYKHVKTTSGFEWFYEARGGGWWQYDERSIQELEKAFEAGNSTCQLLIAGHLYDIDFSQMTQFRQNNRNLFRRIKRDTASAEKRGIAGIRLNQASRGSNGAANGGDGNGPTSGRRRRQAANQSSQNTPGDTLTTPNIRPGSQSQSDSSQSQPSSRSSTGSGQLVVVSESESDNECIGEEEDEGRDSGDSDYIADEEDDMELGEDEELGESNSEAEDEELRDGARAPTRRSDRSNSSTNQTPPPASVSNGGTVVNGSSRNSSNTSPNSSNPSGRASRGARTDKTNAGSRSSTIINNGGGTGGGVPGSAGAVNHGNGSSGSSPSPQFLIDGGMRTISASNIRLSPAPVQSDAVLPSQTGCINNLGSSRTSSSSITTTTGLTCLLIGPGVRITVDKDNSNNEGDEIL